MISPATDASVGTPYTSLLGLDDPVIDIKVTPNRADCLGVRGIARDLAAAGLGQLTPLDTSPIPGRFRSPIGIEIENRTQMLTGFTNNPTEAAIAHQEKRAPKWDPL